MHHPSLSEPRCSLKALEVAAAFPSCPRAAVLSMACHGRLQVPFPAQNFLKLQEFALNQLYYFPVDATANNHKPSGLK